MKDTLEKNVRQQKLREKLDAMKESAKPVFDDAYFAAPKPEAAPASKPEKKEQ